MLHSSMNLEMQQKWFFSSNWMFLPNGGEQSPNIHGLLSTNDLSLVKVKVLHRFSLLLYILARILTDLRVTLVNMAHSMCQFIKVSTNLTMPT